MSQPSQFNMHSIKRAARKEAWYSDSWNPFRKNMGPRRASTWTTASEPMREKDIERGGREGVLEEGDEGGSPLSGIQTEPTFEGIHKNDGEAGRHTPWTRVYSKATNYKRKALRCLVGGTECFARPDSASDRDIITEAFAKECGIIVKRGDKDKSLFKLGTGKVIESTGRALVPMSLFVDGQSTEHDRWFDVLAKCPAPMILGMNFIRKFKLFTENKRMLVDCPYNFGNLPALKWIGSPQERIEFLADGRSLTAGADTGSDLDLMSLHCARRRGFKVDTSQSARNRVMLADETIVETIGQVNVSSVQLSQFDSFEMSFHVLPGLPCDVIFGEEFLDQMDAFNTCDIVHLDKNIIHSLNTLINLGPIQAFLSRNWASKPDNTAQQEHDEAIEAEIYRRNKANRALTKIKDETRVAAASEAEEVKRRAFDAGHLRCMHCIEALVGREPLGG
ncbi:hypothetical protein BGZ57DRAFT_919489 [Hyaloscypha finlandica]|nr:hypothetical protein BGZ57DRAFT_919489 [Hyaloscypha finlandica]